MNWLEELIRRLQYGPGRSTPSQIYDRGRVYSDTPAGSRPDAFEGNLTNWMDLVRQKMRQAHNPQGGPGTFYDLNEALANRRLVDRMPALDMLTLEKLRRQDLDRVLNNSQAFSENVRVNPGLQNYTRMGMTPPVDADRLPWFYSNGSRIYGRPM